MVGSTSARTSRSGASRFPRAELGAGRQCLVELSNQGDCPCGNDSIFGGCASGTGSGASISRSGSSSVAADDLVLTVTGLEPDKSGIFFMGRSSVRSPLGDGLFCVSDPQKIFRFIPPIPVPGSGTVTLGPGIVAFADANFEVPIGQIDSGET